MSENSSRNSMNDVNEAWTKVGEAFNHATELYLKDLTTYLDWAQDFQREVLEETLSRTQQFYRLGEERMAFWSRIRESVPVTGTVSKGSKTGARETGRAE